MFIPINQIPIGFFDTGKTFEHKAVGYHWFLIVVDFLKKEICSYDSLGEVEHAVETEVCSHFGTFFQPDVVCAERQEVSHQLEARSNWRNARGHVLDSQNNARRETRKHIGLWNVYVKIHRKPGGFCCFRNQQRQAVSICSRVFSIGVFDSDWMSRDMPGFRQELKEELSQVIGVDDALNRRVDSSDQQPFDNCVDLTQESNTPSEHMLESKYEQSQAYRDQHDSMNAIFEGVNPNPFGVPNRPQDSIAAEPDANADDTSACLSVCNTQPESPAAITQTDALVTPFVIDPPTHGAGMQQPEPSPIVRHIVSDPDREQTRTDLEQKVNVTTVQFEQLVKKMFGVANSLLPVYQKRRIAINHKNRCAMSRHIDFVAKTFILNMLEEDSRTCGLAPFRS